jgi:tRNA A-37 threonylcarbamoyl transferase component Bud32
MKSSPRVGDIFDNRFELLDVLGTGGQSTVFKAIQLDCQRQVAVKILKADLAEDEEFKERFIREARALSRFSHESIVTVYRIAVSESGLPYMVMELVKGATLRQRLNVAGPLAPAAALAVIRRCNQALQHVHENGIVHRDLKPENIVLANEPEPDGVKLIDFGLARFDEARQQKLTSTGALIGSVFYMSPEQCQGLRADCRSDIYSLTACLYEMLTGQKPYQADNPIGLMYKHINSPAPQILKNQIQPFDSRINEFLARGMAKDPQQRYQSMAELAGDLKILEESWGRPGLSPHLPGLQEKADLRKTPVAGVKVVCLAMVAAALLVAFCFVGWSLKNGQAVKVAGTAPAADRYFEELKEHGFSWKYLIGRVQELDKQEKSLEEDELVRAYLANGRRLAKRHREELAPFCSDPLLAERCLDDGSSSDTLEHAYLQLAAGKFREAKRNCDDLLGPQPEFHEGNPDSISARLIACRAAHKLEGILEARKQMERLTNLSQITTDYFPYVVRTFLDLDQPEVVDSYINRVTSVFVKDAARPVASRQTASLEKFKTIDYPRWKAAQDMALVAQVSDQRPDLRGKAMSVLKSIMHNIDRIDFAGLNLFLDLERTDSLAAVPARQKLALLAGNWLEMNQAGAFPKSENCVVLPSTLVGKLISRGLYAEADRLLKHTGYYSFKAAKWSSMENFEEQLITSVLLAHQSEPEVAAMLGKIPVSRRRLY